MGKKTRFVKFDPNNVKESTARSEETRPKSLANKGVPLNNSGKKGVLSKENTEEYSSKTTSKTKEIGLKSDTENSQQVQKSLGIGENHRNQDKESQDMGRKTYEHSSNRKKNDSSDNRNQNEEPEEDRSRRDQNEVKKDRREPHGSQSRRNQDSTHEGGRFYSKTFSNSQNSQRQSNFNRNNNRDNYRHENRRGTDNNQDSDHNNEYRRQNREDRGNRDDKSGRESHRGQNNESRGVWGGNRGHGDFGTRKDSHGHNKNLHHGQDSKSVDPNYKGKNNNQRNNDPNTLSKKPNDDWDHNPNLSEQDVQKINPNVSWYDQTMSETDSSPEYVQHGAPTTSVSNRGWENKSNIKNDSRNIRHVESTPETTDSSHEHAQSFSTTRLSVEAKAFVPGERSDFNTEVFDEPSHSRERHTDLRDFEVEKDQSEAEESSFKDGDNEDAWYRNFNNKRDDRPKPYDKNVQKEAQSHSNWRDKSESTNESSSRKSRSNYHHRDSLDFSDKEYLVFKKEFDKTKHLKNIEEINGDLFAMPKEYSLAHCVAEDLRMGSGIAVQFKRDFKQIGNLLNQRQRQGGLAFLHDESNKRYIYYLVTKRESTGKPTYETMWKSLQKLRDHMKENHVAKLAIPRLGCGLDRLEWNDVKAFIGFLFRDLPIEIVVCNFQQNTEDDAPPQKSKTCKVVDEMTKHISQIESLTTILYFLSETTHITQDIRELDRKFNIIKDINAKPTKRMGDLIRTDYQRGNEYYALYGCVVKKQHDIDFVHLEKCVTEINKNNKKDQYEYVALQAISSNTDILLLQKVLTVLKNCLWKVDIYVCYKNIES